MFSILTHYVRVLMDLEVWLSEIRQVLDVLSRCASLILREVVLSTEEASNIPTHVKQSRVLVI